MRRQFIIPSGMRVSGSTAPPPPDAPPPLPETLGYTPYFVEDWQQPVSLRSSTTTNFTHTGLTNGSGRWTGLYQYQQWGSNQYGGSHGDCFFLNMAHPDVAAACSAAGWTPLIQGPDGIKLRQQRKTTLPASLQTFLNGKTDKNWIGVILTSQHFLKVRAPFFTRAWIRVPNMGDNWPSWWSLGEDKYAASGPDTAPQIECDIAEFSPGITEVPRYITAANHIGHVSTFQNNTSEWSDFGQSYYGKATYQPLGVDNPGTQFVEYACDYVSDTIRDFYINNQFLYRHDLSQNGLAPENTPRWSQKHYMLFTMGINPGKSQEAYDQRVANNWVPYGSPQPIPAGVNYLDMELGNFEIWRKPTTEIFFDE